MLGFSTQTPGKKFREKSSSATVHIEWEGKEKARQWTCYSNGRSSGLKVFCKKAVLKNFANSQGSTCARVLKKTLVNFAKFLRTPFFIEHLWWLLLSVNGSMEREAGIFYRSLAEFFAKKRNKPNKQITNTQFICDRFEEKFKY